MKGEKIYTNFNGRIQAFPHHLYRPRNKQQVKEIIRRHKHVRVFAGRHVFNPISASDCVMMDMSRIRFIKVNVKQQTVTIGAGVSVGELLSCLASYNLSLPVHVFTPCTSVIGALSTGSHGSNFLFGSMSDLLVSAQLVIADGTLKLVQRGHVLKAVRCGLGCLGIIYSATLRCVPLYEYFQITCRMPWRKWVRLQKRLLSIFPYTIVRVDPFDMKLMATVQLIRKVPPGYGNAPTLDTVQSCSLYYLETELAFAFSQADEAVHAVSDYHRRMSAKLGIKTDRPLLIRYSGPDHTHISMSSKRRSVFIGNFFGSDVAARKATLFLRRLSSAMVRQFRARPHYGKINSLTAHQMMKLYGHHYIRFLQLRKRLDPEGKFLNPYTANLVA